MTKITDSVVCNELNCFIKLAKIYCGYCDLHPHVLVNCYFSLVVRDLFKVQLTLLQRGEQVVLLPGSIALRRVLAKLNVPPDQTICRAGYAKPMAVVSNKIEY